MYTLKKKYQCNIANIIKGKEEDKEAIMHVNYEITIILKNAALKSNGNLIDCNKLDVIKKWLYEHVDQRLINTISGEPATLENFAKWFFDVFYEILNHFLAGVEITRNGNISASYSPHNNLF